MSAAALRLWRLAEELGAQLQRRRALLVCAESCTGGGVAYAVTQIAGSSGWFERGFVVYADRAKQDLLGVPLLLLREHGAVSEPVAQAMAMGALERSSAHAALAVTGIAGPDGGSAAKPVGTVCFAWALRAGPGAQVVLRARTRHFDGDRAAVRTQSIEEALQGLLDFLPPDR
jgi:nicotinamide-nucleotide amidase